MPTVIDSFVLELGLDPSKFTAGQREAMDQMRRFQEASLGAGNQVEAQSKRIFNLLSDFRREALTGLGLFLGGRGLGEFVNYVTTLDASTGRFARTIDMTAQATSDWQGAFEQIGGTAESADSALGGLSAEMNRFQQTGQSAMLPVLSRLGISLYDQNRHLKTAGQLWLELADSVQGMDPAQATAFLNMIPGANQDMINFALMGRRAMEQYIADADRARRLTDQNVESAKEWQKQMGLLERAAVAVGEKFAMWLLPIEAVKKLSELLSTWHISPSSPEGRKVVSDDASAIRSKFGTPASADEWLRSILGGPGPGPFSLLSYALGGGDAQGGGSAAGGGGGGGTAGGGSAAGGGGGGGIEAFIRAAAAARGIDPNQAVRVFSAESGLNPGAVGDQGTSFGVAQLHYGGGLGDIFTQQTGLKANDPSTTKQQINFALDWAKVHGWSDWHAWKGAPFAGIGVGGGAAPGGGTNVNVGGVTIYTDKHTADGIAGDLDGALQRSLTAGAANNGPQ